MGILKNGVFLAIIAHGLIGLTLVWDKILLRQPGTKSVVNYVFWLGAMSGLGVLLGVLGFHMPSARVALLALGAGVLHLVANYFYYAALGAGEASQTLAIMGGFSPLATALIGSQLLKQPLGGKSVLGFALLVAGGFLMFFSEKTDIRRILPSVLLASGFFGLTNVLQKMAFDETDFVSGYILFTIGTFLASLLLLVPKSWREQIFETSKEAPPERRFWYFTNRFVSGVGSFLTFFAISRADPAIVDAISGVRYAIVFLGAYVITKWKPDWLQEQFSGWTLAAKTIATMLVTAGLVLVSLEGDTLAAAYRHAFGPRALRIFITISGPKAHGGQDWRRYLTALAVLRPPPPSSNRPTADPSRVPSGQISPAEFRADNWRRWLEPQS